MVKNEGKKGKSSLNFMPKSHKNRPKNGHKLRLFLLKFFLIFIHIPLKGSLILSGKMVFLKIILNKNFNIFNKNSSQNFG